MSEPESTATFPNLDALRLNLSWTHHRLHLRVDSATALEWYMNDAATQNWNTRELTHEDIGQMDM